MKKWLALVGIGVIMCVNVAFAATSSGEVNLNQADVKQLMSLKGIGKRRAQAIVDYRKVHGEFHNLSDLTKVPGISPTVYKKLQDANGNKLAM